ncbi:unnamed protein product [Caenorhabditis auriculariae]|uniref:Uncharacterized protein n=1 Tax=Caenorhabditis auriculariae TaxID=2777116 RepID=A0A8S1GRG5_9PELO|nr:unnamed protein product [Caenorhabditis auriculariae]
MLRYCVVLVAVLAVPTLAQMVRQCSCSEVDPCLHVAESGIMQCADQCQNHVAAIGANYGKMRACMLEKEPMFKQAFSCQQNKLSDSCSKGGGGQVPKRYPETLKLAAFSEINSILQKSGIQAEAKSFLSVGKKFGSCVMKCMDRGSTGSCYKKLGCGLALPSDSILVQQTKQCAIQAGFNTAGVRQLCSCVAASGIPSLGSLCERIVIS